MSDKVFEKWLASNSGETIDEWRARRRWEATAVRELVRTQWWLRNSRAFPDRKRQQSPEWQTFVLRVAAEVACG